MSAPPSGYWTNCSPPAETAAQSLSLITNSINSNFQTATLQVSYVSQQYVNGNGVPGGVNYAVATFSYSPPASNVAQTFKDFANAFISSAVDSITRSGIDFEKVWAIALAKNCAINLASVLSSGLLTGQQINAFSISNGNFNSFISQLIANKIGLSLQEIKDLDATHYAALLQGFLSNSAGSCLIQSLINQTSAVKLMGITSITNAQSFLSLLSPTQLQYCTSDGVPICQLLAGDLTCAQFSGLSTSLQNGLIINQNGSLSSSIINNLTPSQLGLQCSDGKFCYQKLTPTEISLISWNKFSGLSIGGQNWLMLNSANNLSATVIGNLTGVQLKYSTSNGTPIYQNLGVQVSNLTGVQLNYSTSNGTPIYQNLGAQVSNLTGVQLNYSTSNGTPIYQNLGVQAASLGWFQFNALSILAQNWLITNAGNNLNTNFFVVETWAQFNSLNALNQSWLITNAGNNLSDDIVGHLSSAQLNLQTNSGSPFYQTLNSVQITSLSNSQLNYATPSGALIYQGLTGDEFGSLTGLQLSGFSSTEITSQIGNLTNAQLASSFTSQNGKSVNVISLLSGTQIAMLNSAQIDVNVFALMTKNQVQSICNATISDTNYDVLKNAIDINRNSVLGDLTANQLSVVNSVQALVSKAASGDIQGFKAGAIELDNNELEVIQAGLKPETILNSDNFFISETLSQLAYNNPSISNGQVASYTPATIGATLKNIGNLAFSTKNSNIYSVTFRALQFTELGNANKSGPVAGSVNNYIQSITSNYLTVMNAQRSVFQPSPTNSTAETVMNTLMWFGAYLQAIGSVNRWAPQSANSQMAGGTTEFYTANDNWSMLQALNAIADIGMEVTALILKGGTQNSNDQIAMAASIQTISGQAITTAANLLRFFSKNGSPFTQVPSYGVVMGIGNLISLSASLTSMAKTPSSWNAQTITAETFSALTAGIGVIQSGVLLNNAFSQKNLSTALDGARSNLGGAKNILTQSQESLELATQNANAANATLADLNNQLAEAALQEANQNDNIALDGPTIYDQALAELMPQIEEANQTQLECEAELSTKMNEVVADNAAVATANEGVIAAEDALRAGSEIGSSIAGKLNIAVGIIAAANPMEYLQAQNYIKEANSLSKTSLDYANAGNSAGSQEASSLSAFYQTMGDKTYAQASVDSALTLAGSIASSAGTPGMIAGLIIGAVQAIFDACMNASIQGDRANLGSATGSATQSVKNDLQGQFSSMVNALIGGASSSGYSSQLLENGGSFSQIALFGGETISQTEAALGIAATDGYLGPDLFSEMGTSSSNNFASILGKNANQTSQIDLFQNFAKNSNQQSADLSSYIDTTTTENTTQNSPIITEINFISPLAIPQLELSQINTSSAKNQSTIQYLSNKVTGMTLNLAGDNITNDEEVILDTSNLLTNYIAGDSSNGQLVTMQDQVALGNAQYYIRASVTNCTYENAPDNSGSGIATLDYNPVVGIGGCNIAMQAGSTSLQVTKNLSNSIAYYQENNGGSVSGSYGKNTASATYIQLQKKTDASTLKNQVDAIEASSCITQIIATKGTGNILSGYGGMTLEAGSSGSYYFNINSASYNNGQIFSYSDSNINAVAEIDLIQGLNPTITTNLAASPTVQTKLSAADNILIGNVLNFNDILFDINANNSDITIINGETRLAVKVYDFSDNVQQETIKIQSGNIIETISGAALWLALASAVDQGYIANAEYANQNGAGNNVATEGIYDNTTQGDTIIRNTVTQNSVGTLSSLLSSQANSVSFGQSSTLKTNLNAVVNAGQYYQDSQFGASNSASGSFDLNSIYDLSGCGSNSAKQSAVVNFTGIGQGYIFKTNITSSNPSITTTYGEDTFNGMSQIFGPNCNTAYNGVQGNAAISVDNLTTNIFNIGTSTYDALNQTVLATDSAVYNTDLELNINNGAAGQTLIAGNIIGKDTINVNLDNGYIYCAINQFGNMIVQSMAPTSQWTLQLDNFNDITSSNNATDTCMYNSIQLHDTNSSSSSFNLTAANLASLASAEAAYQNANTGMSNFSIAQNFNVHTLFGGQH